MARDSLLGKSQKIDSKRNFFSFCIILQPLSSDPHQIPDIVSGHAAIAASATTSTHHSGGERDQNMPTAPNTSGHSGVISDALKAQGEMGPPCRPPRRSKRFDNEASGDISFEVGNI